MGKKLTKAPWLCVGLLFTMVAAFWKSVDRDGPTAHISNVANRNKSVELTEQGLAEAEGLAKKLFS
jgi:hypothetical protein